MHQIKPKKTNAVCRPPADAYPTIYRSDGTVPHIKKLSHRHHAIMDFLLANPALPMSEVARHFGVSQAWLSTVRQSDLFRERFAERRAMMDEDQARKITARLADIAENGVEAIGDIIADEEQDGRLKLDATKTALEALGFLGKGGQRGLGAAQREAEPDPATNAVQVNIGMGDFETARRIAMGTEQLTLPNEKEVN